MQDEGLDDNAGPEREAREEHLIASLKSLAGESDIEALAFSVMMQATRGADEDLRSIMEEVKAITATKAALRQLISKINRDVAASAHCDVDSDDLTFAAKGLGSEAAYHAAPLPVIDVEAVGGVRFVGIDLHQGVISSLRELRAVRDELRSKLDSMSEMGELESLRLQMMMDRRSKFITTLSNLLKKISTTQDTLVQNLK